MMIMMMMIMMILTILMTMMTMIVMPLVKEDYNENDNGRILAVIYLESCSVFVFEASPVFVLWADIVLVSERKLYLFGRPRA